MLINEVWCSCSYIATHTHTQTRVLANNMALPGSPEGAVLMSTPRFAFRPSMIPRPMGSKIKIEVPEDSLSPKSVIVDRRFISPASSSSSSIDRRNNNHNNTLSDAGNHFQKSDQPRHDRGYSISDGEFSDPDSCVDSTGTSLELGKVTMPMYVVSGLWF